MADIVKQILARPIQLADQIIIQLSDPVSVSSFKQDCSDIRTKTERLAVLLRQAARASHDLYERPTRRIMDDTEQVLDKTLQIVFKCRASGIRRVFTIIPAAAVRKCSQQLENSVGDVSWLLRVSAPAEERDDEYLGLPPIAANEPILCLIWEQIAILCSSTALEQWGDAAASLVSLARDNERYGKLIIEEGGVPPLLKLAKEGRMDGQESAARAVGLLGRDPESVERIVNAGVCSVFGKLLKEGHMRVQLVVAWAVSELAANHPKCQDHFSQNNVIRLLVSHLAFETIQEHSKYAIAYKHNNNNNNISIHNVIIPHSNSKNNIGKGQEDDEKPHINMRPPTAPKISEMRNIVTDTIAMKDDTLNKNTHEHHHRNIEFLGASIKGREFEDPDTKKEMKAMSARALWHLCAGNLSICRIMTESRALLCFATLIEKGEDEVQFNSLMALTEITAVAEQHCELRRSAFKPTSPAGRGVVDQLLKVITKGESKLLIPSIQAIGNLARTFRATETRIIGPLVGLLEDSNNSSGEGEISTEVAVALVKFACSENFLHVNHCKAILEAGGGKHLIQLTYFGEQMVQYPALILLSYISMHVPDDDTLAQDEVVIVLEWALKQPHFMQLETLITEAKQRLEIYATRTTTY